MANATDTKRKSKENQHFKAHIIRTIKFEAPKIRQSEDCLIFIQSEGLLCNLAIASMFFLIVQYSLAN